MNSYGYASTIEVFPSYSMEVKENKSKKIWGAVFYVTLVTALIIPYVLYQNMQTSMQERDRLFESQIRNLQDRVNTLELRKKTELGNLTLATTFTYHNIQILPSSKSIAYKDNSPNNKATWLLV